MSATGRRLLLGRVRLAQRSWADVAPELEFFLNRIWESEANGLPAGFNNVNPDLIQPDDPASPGTQASGWAAADHQHPIVTEVPVDVGFANAEGSSTAFARSDHVHGFHAMAVTPISGDHVVDDEDVVLLVDASGGDVTISLPAANLRPGRLLEVKKIDSSANAVIVDAAGADLIDGEPDFELLFEDEAVPIISDGISEWSVL